MGTSDIIRVFSLLDAVATCPAGEVLDHLETMPPDDDVMRALRAFDRQRLTPGEQVRVLRLWEASSSWAVAQQQPWIVEVAGPARTEDDWAVEEVGAALKLSNGASAKRVFVARTLQSRFPRMLALLSAGGVTWQHAQILCTDTRPLDDAAAHWVESRVLRKAGKQTIGEFKAAVHRAVIAADAELAAQRFAAAKAQRCVRFIPLANGMAIVESVLPAADAMTVWRGLDAVARRMKLDDPADPRGIEARRADALTGLCAQAAADPAVAGSSRLPTTLGVTMDYPTLTGLADNPGHLDGYGAIPADVARQLAGDATWRLMLTDALSGRLLKVGTIRYKPTVQLAELITARDRSCRFPGCQQPGYRCDIDHRNPYDHNDPAGGGQTDEDNCQLLCERHHRVKHETCWRVDLINADTLEWTSPTGQRYTVDAEDLGPMEFRPHEYREPDLPFFERKPPGESPRPPVVEPLDPPF
ncbi:MAG: hypothetical protein QOK14_56 [Frankiaceae bacterium]|nr:hypothetical protein [Frankiaceae bacterium]